jgi:hypothetical protein
MSLSAVVSRDYVCVCVCVCVCVYTLPFFSRARRDIFEPERDYVPKLPYHSYPVILIISLHHLIPAMHTQSCTPVTPIDSV